MAASRSGWNNLVRHETGVFSIDAVYRSIDRAVVRRINHPGKQRFNAVYCYEDGALLTFLKARQHGLHCFYDLPIGYWRASRHFLEREKDHWPDWMGTLTGFNDSAAKLQNKDEELRLADRIYVASQFTANSLKFFPGKLAPVEVIPYGFPAVTAERKYSPPYQRALKVLFVGSLSQRKGVANLFSAVNALKNKVELTLVGHKTSLDCTALDHEVVKHRWYPSLPNKDILALMQHHDVLAFPSLFEGFGLVITEAMSQGTPVITTDRTVGPDIIEDGRNGWLIEAGSTQALQGVLENLLYNPALVAEVGKAAMETARQRPWETYSRELAASVSMNSTYN